MQNIVALSKYLMSVIALHLASRAGLLGNLDDQAVKREEEDRQDDSHPCNMNFENELHSNPTHP